MVFAEGCLQPPELEPDDTRRGLVSFLASVCLVGQLFAVVASAATPELRAGVPLVALTIPPLAVVFLFLRRGQVSGAAAWLVGVAHALVTATSFGSGGLDSGVPALFGACAVMAALLLGPWAGAASTALGAATIVTLYSIGASDVLLVTHDLRVLQFQNLLLLVVLVGVASSWSVARLRAVTERRLERAAAVARECELADALLQSIPEPVFVVDQGRSVLRANAAAAALLGAAVPAGAPLADYFCADGRLAASDGTIPVELTSAQVVDPDGRRQEVIVASDLRAREAAEQRVGEASRAAGEATRLRSLVLTGMSHEIRAPLNVIINLAELLVEDLDGPARQDSERIRRAGRHLLGVVNDILDLAKIEAGRMELYMEPVELQALLDAIVAELADAASAQRTLVRREGEVPEQWPSDRHKLSQILTNLVSNAVRFTNGGEVVVRVTPGEALVVEVADTGPGIAPERLAALLHPFEARDTASSPLGGAGVGLAVTAEFVRLLGGTLQIRSALGRGSTFTVTLPRLG